MHGVEADDTWGSERRRRDDTPLLAGEDVSRPGSGRAANMLCGTIQRDPRPNWRQEVTGGKHERNRHKNAAMALACQGGSCFTTPSNFSSYAVVFATTVLHLYQPTLHDSQQYSARLTVWYD